MKLIPLLSLTALFVATFSVSHAAEAVPLFDGKTLDGWDGEEGLWRVEDGLITGETTEEHKLTHNSFLIWKKGTVTDFEIEFDFRIMSDWANSGLQYRSKDMGDHIVAGYQADLDSGAAHTGISYGEKTTRGIMANRGQRVWLGDGKKKNKSETFADNKALQALIKGKGEWNHYKVIAKGTTMTHLVNGTLMSETIDESKTDAVMEGILALQLHQGQPMKIQYKDIMLTDLK
jgi:Domain of Unknown Function (DUF1080)